MARKIVLHFLNMFKTFYRLNIVGRKCSKTTVCTNGFSQSILICMSFFVPFTSWHECGLRKTRRKHQKADNPKIASVVSAKWSFSQKQAINKKFGVEFWWIRPVRCDFQLKNIILSNNPSIHLILTYFFGFCREMRELWLIYHKEIIVIFIQLYFLFDFQKLLLRIRHIIILTCPLFSSCSLHS